MPDNEKESLSKLMDTMERAIPKMSPENFQYILGYGTAIADIAPDRTEKTEKKEEAAAVV